MRAILEDRVLVDKEKEKVRGGRWSVQSDGLGKVGVHKEGARWGRGYEQWILGVGMVHTENLVRGIERK